MINYIHWAWFWAWVRNGTHSSTITVRIPNRRVTAQASLSRVSWDSEGKPRYAKAFIRTYCYYHSSDQRLCPYYSNPDSAPSVVTINNASSITFEIRVRASSGGAEMYGYGTGMVFVH